MHALCVSDHAHCAANNTKHTHTHIHILMHKHTSSTAIKAASSKRGAPASRAAFQCGCLDWNAGSYTWASVCRCALPPPPSLFLSLCLCVFLHAWVRLLAAAGRRLPFILNSQRGKIAKRKNAKERTKRWRKKRWKSNKHFVAAATPKISARRGRASLSPSSQKCFAMQFE